MIRECRGAFRTARGAVLVKIQLPVKALLVADSLRSRWSPRLSSIRKHEFWLLVPIMTRSKSFLDRASQFETTRKRQTRMRFEISIVRTFSNSVAPNRLMMSKQGSAHSKYFMHNKCRALAERLSTTQYQLYGDFLETCKEMDRTGSALHDPQRYKRFSSQRYDLEQKVMAATRVLIVTCSGHPPIVYSERKRPLRRFHVLQSLPRGHRSLSVRRASYGNVYGRSPSLPRHERNSGAKNPNRHRNSRSVETFEDYDYRNFLRVMEEFNHLKEQNDAFNKTESFLVIPWVHTFSKVLVLVIKEGKYTFSNKVSTQWEEEMKVIEGLQANSYKSESSVDCP